MIRVIRCALLGLHFVFGSIAGLLIGLARPFNPTNSRLCAQLYGFFGLPIIGLKVEIKGIENYPIDRPFVVVCNHQSNWDLFVAGKAVPARTVSIGKKQLKWIPLFGQLYWLAGNIMIDRSDHKKAMQSMDTTREALREKNTNIWFFPEGTRNHGKNMLPFKKGGFVTAINAGVPIVPVCVDPYLENFSLGKWDNGTAKVHVLPLIETANIDVENVEPLMQGCHKLMLQVINRSRQ